MFSHFVNLRIRFVVFAGVIEHQDEIGDQVVQRLVTVAFQLLRNYFQVYGLLNHFVVIRIFLRSKRQKGCVSNLRMTKTLCYKIIGIFAIDFISSHIDGLSILFFPTEVISFCISFQITVFDYCLGEIVQILSSTFQNMIFGWGQKLFFTFQPLKHEVTMSQKWMFNTYKVSVQSRQ